MADEIRKTNSFSSWAKALATPVLTIAMGAGAGYIGLEVRVRGMESRIEKNAEDLRSVRALDPDGFHDPTMRSGIDRQIRSSHRDPDFWDFIQLRMERAYKLDTLRK